MNCKEEIQLNEPPASVEEFVIKEETLQNDLVSNMSAIILK